MIANSQLESIGLATRPDREIIDWMARINDISCDVAAAEFVYGSDGTIAKFLLESGKSTPDPRPGDVYSWAAKRAIGAKWYSGADKSLANIVAATLGPNTAPKNTRNIKQASRLPAAALPHDTHAGLFDHARILTEQGRRAFIGFTLAPYISLDAEVIAETADTLRDLGLKVRMGRAADDWYGCGSFPVMVWNPDRVTIPESHDRLEARWF